MKNKRFELTKSEGLVEGSKIITDTKTGVQYLFYFSGYGGGLTPLIDETGKPLLANSTSLVVDDLNEEE